MPTLHEARQTARKEYTCDECRGPIHKGQRYWRAYGSSDDSMRNPRPYTLRVCRHCDPELRAEPAPGAPSPQLEGAPA